VRDTSSKAMPPLLVDGLEAGRLLCVCRNTVDNLRRRGELPSIKVAGRRLYAVDDLRAYIARQRETAGGRA
jgi:hypothetical protein